MGYRDVGRETISKETVMTEIHLNLSRVTNKCLELTKGLNATRHNTS